MEEEVSLDTDTADEGTAADLRRLTEVVDELPQTVEDEPVGADLLRYEITFGDDVTERSVAFLDDGSVEKAEVRALADRIIMLPGKRDT